MTPRRAIAPVMLVAIVIAAAVHDSASSSEGAAAQQAEPAGSAASSPGTSGRTAGEDFDTLDIIAESLAVNVSTDGLKARALRSIDMMRGPIQVVRRDWNNPRQFLRAFFLESDIRTADGLAEARKAATELPEVPALGPDRLASGQGNRLDAIQRFLTRYFNQDALAMKSASDEAKLLAEDFESLDKWALKLAVLRQAAEAQDTTIEFLIATLPDAIDSYAGWQFDPMLDAITQAISASDYVLDRFHFPDFDVEEGSSGTAEHQPGRGHELEPGVVIFRKHENHSSDAKASERLVLLIVHENPTAGIHARALANAIRFVVRCESLTKPEVRTVSAARKTLRILGPTFSGSSETMRRTLGLVERSIVPPSNPDGGYNVRIVSGSATDQRNQSTIQGAIPGRVVFQATVHPDSVLFPEMVRQIARAAWSKQIAVLFESNTQYGRQLWEVWDELSRQTSSEGSRSQPLDLIQLPFPMNVSRLRKTEQAERSRSANLWLPSKFRPLAMEGKGNPSDQIPQFHPSTTATYVELALAGTLDTMRREHIKTVALMATDPRDKLFLAQQLAQHSPDVSIFTAESDSLYIHPDYSTYLQGALVVSTYPLYSANQRWSYGFQGRSERRQFANGSAQGIYNATLALLHYDHEGNPRPPDPTASPAHKPPRLLEYGLPGKGCSERCQPPVWISVVGRTSAWPVKAYTPPQPSSDRFPAEASSYVFTVAEPTDLELPAVFPSPFFNAFLILLTFVTIGYWSRVKSVLLRSSASGDGLLPLSPGRHAARQRAYLLVCLAGPTLILFFIGVLTLMRFRIERSFYSASALIAVSVGLLGLCDVTARVLTRVVRFDLTHLRGTAGGRPLARWLAAAAAAVGLWSLWNLGQYLQDYALESRMDVISFVARAVDLGSGVSPTLPLLFLAGAFTLWGLCELARVRRPRVAIAEQAVHPLVQHAMHGDLDGLKASWELFHGSILIVPPRLAGVAALAFVATCVFAFDPFFAPLVTIEGAPFGRFVSAAVLLVQVMLTLSLLQFVFLWARMNQLLKRMAWHALASAYDRVPRALFPTNLFPRVPRLMELQIPVAHWTRLVAEAQLPGDIARMPKECRHIDLTFEKDMLMSPDKPWSRSHTWEALLKAGSYVTQPRAAVSGAPSDAAVAAAIGPIPPLIPPAPPKSAGPAAQERPDVREVDDFVAMLLAFVIRDGLARLAHNLVFVIGGVVFVFCSHTLFPFQQHTHLRILGWIYIGLTFTAILTVLVQMKRNEIIGRLTSTSPGTRTTWDSEFVLKLAVFGLLPLLTLFAAQFPDVGGLLIRWLEPVQKVLP